MTWTHALDDPIASSLDEAKALVGGKAANLGVMVRDLGLPVPPGFVITTAACRAFLAAGWPDGLEAELRDRMSGLRRRSHGGSPTRPTRSSSAFGRARRCRCPG